MLFSYGLAGDCDIRVHGFQNSKSVSDFENAIANRKNGWISKFQDGLEIFR